MKLFYFLMSLSLFSCGTENMSSFQTEDLSISLLSSVSTDDRLDPSFIVLDRKTLNLNGHSIDFVHVPGGVAELYKCGTLNTNFERKVLKERLDSYWISTTMMTQDIYRAVMGQNPSVNQEGRYPIHNIGYADAVSFIGKLNDQLKKNDIEIEVSLPNDFQWIHAVNGGQSTNFYWGDDIREGSEFEWLDYVGDQSEKMHPVAQKKPNPYGLYDGVGHCSEFVQPLLPAHNIDGRELSAVIGLHYYEDLDMADFFRYTSPAGRDHGPWSMTSFRLVCK
ncbi:MAG: formylglycine-generating enzyme family protein [Oligoflexales bacterium]